MAADVGARPALTVPGEIVGCLVSVNVGRPRSVVWKGRTVRTAIWKSPVEGRVAVAGVNLSGDAQADRRVHGGPDKAVYAYAVEDYRWWQEELGAPLAPGTFGENLTTESIDLSHALVGERWAVGSTTLEVCQPRMPCFKLGIRMGDAAFVERFDDAARYGAYLRIIEPGEVGAGDDIVVVHRPPNGLRLDDLARADQDADPSLLRDIVATPAVPAGRRNRAARGLARWAAKSRRLRSPGEP